jgi:ABC-2 type transport system permease protein
VLSTISLIAKRELNSKLRTRAFAISTVVSIIVLAALVLMESTIFSGGNKTVVGLNGQAIAVAGDLTAAAGRIGEHIETREITDPAAGAAMVADGDLDAFVTGAGASLSVLVKQELDQGLRTALDSVVQQEVLKGRLAGTEELPRATAEEILDRVAAAHAEVRTVEPDDPAQGQRLALTLLIVALLYVSLVLYGTMVAQGIVEEKSSRVVEILLSTVRPRQLLVGKLLGLGLVGLIQLAIVGGVGLVLAIVTDVLSIPSVAAGTLLWGLLWYLLGFFLYATVFAAAGSLVSRQEETQAVLTPITLVLVAAFVIGFSVLTQDASGTASTVLSLLPPFSPILMPGRIALDAAPFWQVGTAIVLTLATIAVLTSLGAKIYANAVLHMGTRVKLREALRRLR